MFELANPVCTILVSFTPWTVFMPEFATITLLAGILIVEEMAKLLISIFLTYGHFFTSFSVHLL